ncbi:Uncharacterized protein DAT39_009122 [Clarias magur]|uniref:Uncharacterized protein n=1 Tax=Clarias magur TaxID=1594786 RepID=A0A8J4URR7_CLAMG|nr:Uncharacterized protein DAT39_009122 [Clarias magur]
MIEDGTTDTDLRDLPSSAPHCESRLWLGPSTASVPLERFRASPNTTLLHRPNPSLQSQHALHQGHRSSSSDPRCESIKESVKRTPTPPH